MLKKENKIAIIKKNKEKTKGEGKLAKPTLVVMLTQNDVTVKNAKEIFLKAKDAPCRYWGFKEVGLPPEEMKDLVQCMKAAGKMTFLEIVGKTEEECLEPVKLAAECGFDAVTGTVYYDSILEVIKKNHILYMPFIGERYTLNMSGPIDELIEEAKILSKKEGVAGINIAAFRYDGDVEKMVFAVKEAIDKPICCVGSINSYERLDKIKAFQPLYFTIGSAFFEKKFGETFTEQIINVQNYLDK